MGVRHSTTAADTAAAAACVKRTFRREFQTLGRLLALTLLSNVVLARDKLYLGSQLTPEQELADPRSGRYSHSLQRKLHVSVCVTILHDIKRNHSADARHRCPYAGSQAPEALRCSMQTLTAYLTLLPYGRPAVVFWVLCAFI